MSRNKAYWKRRSKQVQDEIMNRVYDIYVAMVEDAYTDAIHVMDEKIRVWVQRIAKNNEISYRDAQKLLSKDELDEFHWSVQQYIKRGMDNADGKWAKELENASARVHISRYDAMKFELQALAKEATGKTIGAVKDATALAYTESYHHTAFNLMQQIGVGITMQGVDSRKLEHILNRPWLDDGKTFTARCWEGCDDLVGRINRELFRMIATGEKPDRAIDAIAKAFGTSKANAGRVIMTESAFVASQAQHDCFTELGVEQFEVIGTFDGRMCEFCGEINGKVFPESKRKIGENAPPFHPWCRCTTAPYFEDMQSIGERWMRDPETGRGGTVPNNMTYQEWKAKYVDKTGESGIIGMKRRSENTGVFSHLPERMSKKHIRGIAKEYGIDLNGVSISIDQNEELLGISVSGRADFEQVGGITFFPLAFSSKEELVRTLFHEKQHVEQFRAFGVEYVQQHRGHFEKLAYEAENRFIQKLKKEGRL